MHVLRLTHHLLVANALPLHGLLVQQRLDADPPGLAAEMTSQRIGPREASATTPVAPGPELALADEFFLTAVQAFVALAIMLPRKRLAADGAHKGAFIGMCAQVRAEVVRAGKALGAERALEGGRVFLHPLVRAGGGRPGRVGQFEYVIAIGDG